MELKNIKSVRCPICGCEVVVGEYVEFYHNSGIKVHANGMRWEHRRFLCGLEIAFDPNFCKEYTRGDCKNDPEYIARLQKQKEDKEKLLQFCKEQSLSENLVRKIKSYVI